MKYAVILGLLLSGVFALPASAGKPAGKKALRQERQEQKASIQELRTKYDLDKDGKLSKKERAAISAEDKEKIAKIKAAHKKPEANKKAEAKK